MMLVWGRGDNRSEGHSPDEGRELFSGSFLVVLESHHGT